VRVGDEEQQSGAGCHRPRIREVGLAQTLKGAAHTVHILVFALALGGLALLAAGESPWHILLALLRGAFGSSDDFARTMRGATPLIFTGLAVAIPFRAGLFNIGGEGQMILAAFTAAAVGHWLAALPIFLLLPACFLAAIAAGAAWGAIAGLFRGRLGVHEVIVTILLNFLCYHLVAYLLRNLASLSPEGTAEPKTEELISGLRLGEIVPGTGIGICLVLAVALALLAEFVLLRTKPGLALRAFGGNPRAAAAVGISSKKVILLTMVTGGGFAALAGVQQVLAEHGSYLEGFSPGLGFTGIAVALLGANRPIGVIFAALFFAVLRSGAFAMDALAGIPREAVKLVEVVVILLVASELIRGMMVRRSAEGESR